MFELRNIVRENIKNLTAYSSARDEFKGDANVFLDANESPFGTLNRYPDSNQSEIKSILAKEKGIATNRIFVGNGSDEAIDLVFRIFCNPGLDKAMVFTPTYGMYEVSAKMNDVGLIEVPLNNDFEIDRTDLEGYFLNPKLKLVFICSPNNPTGNSIEIETIAWILKKFRGIVVVDEAYIDFSKSASLIQLIETYSNLIVLQTMSKARGLAAIRVGFAFSSNEIIDLFNKVKPPYNVSELNQKNAQLALLDQEKYQNELKEILENKQVLEQELKGLEIVKKVYPSDANFFLVEFSKKAGEIYKALIETGVVTRNRDRLVANCLRISVGTKQENKLLIKSLKEIK